VIRVRIDIWPNGDRRRAYTQATAVIWCDPGQGGVRDYHVHAGESQNGVTGAADWSSVGHILAHDRRQSIWALVAKVSAWAAAEAEKR
jgi:hypothetical protein